MRRRCPPANRLFSRSDGTPSNTSRPPFTTSTRSATASTSRRMWVEMRTVLSRAQTADVVAEVPDLVGIEPGRRLVHDEHVRVVQQRLRHPDALPEPPGQLSDGLFHHLIERAERGHFLDPARQGRRPDFARLPEEPEQLRRSHVRIERTVLRQVAKPAGGFETLFVDIEAGDLGGSRARREIAGQHLHRGGLSGAVRPEKEPQSGPWESRSARSRRPRRARRTY